MKLKFLAEAKYDKPVKLAVHEIVADRYEGERQMKYVIDTDILAKFRKAIEDGDDDTLESLEETMPGLGIYSVVSDDYDKAIEPTIRSKGGIGLDWEEGAVGISAKGPKHAKQLAFDAWHQFDDDEEEDWF